MTPAQERASRKREAILDAAERIFAEKGYHEAGIAEIAGLLRIGHGSFYRYFKNKRDIALSILDRIVARMAAAGLAEDPRAAGDLASYRAQTERILASMIAVAAERPFALRFFHEEAQRVDPSRLAHVLDAFAAHTALFLENGVAKGFLREDLDVEPTAQALVALILEGTRRALEPMRSPDELRRWVRAGVGLMYDGIRRGQGQGRDHTRTPPL